MSRLFVSRNNSYILFLDPQGREIVRLTDEVRGASTATSRARILATMQRVLDEPRTGRSGFELLAHLFRSEDAKIRQEALRFLGDVKGNKKQAVGMLIEALGTTGRSGPAHTAAMSLGRLGPAAREAIEPLSALALDQNGYQNVRQESLIALGMIDPAGEKALPVITEALADKDHYVRLGASMGFNELKGVGQRAAPLLLAALSKTKKRGAHYYIIKALQRHPANARIALPALRRLAANTDVPTKPTGHATWDVEEAAREAISAIEAAQDSSD